MTDLAGESAGLWLDASCKGSRWIVREIPAGRSRTQLIRLGITEGEEIFVVERLPGGTIVVEKNRREIAIGAALARRIRVALAGKLKVVAHA